MVELFRNALNYLTASNERQENDFLGKVLVLGEKRLTVRRLLAEGGFGYVFAVTAADGKWYALKRVFAGDSEAQESIKREISFLKEVSGHPHVLQFCAAACEQQAQGRAEFLILTELCTGGPLLKQLRVRHKLLELCEVLPLFYQLCQAIEHLHTRNPPIIHRDLKIENLLLSGTGQLKLCDFGSATVKSYYPDHTWTAQQRTYVTEQINKFTTPMYRAPEMLDLYQNFPIDHRVDIWALGCVLYYLCYSVHPFEDSATLRILNAKYSVPEHDERCGVLHPLIGDILRVDPRERLSIRDIFQALMYLASTYGVDLNGKFELCKEEIPPTGDTNTQVELDSGAGSMGVFLDSLKGQAGSLFKSLRETSSKIVQFHAAAGPVEGGLLQLTGRLLCLPALADIGRLDEAVRVLASRYGSRLAVCDLYSRNCGDLAAPERMFRCNFVPATAPPLKRIFSICKRLYTWLSKSSANLVLFCSDDLSNIVCIGCAFLTFCKVFPDALHARRYFKNKLTGCSLTASQMRYIDYVCSVVKNPAFYPQNNEVLVTAVSAFPVPAFNKAKNGCRPFVEIFSGDKKLYSSCQEYEKIGFFETSQAGFTIPVEVKLDSDITFSVCHARSTLGTKVQGKVGAIKMFQLQVHAGFMDPSNTSLKFMMNELDGLDEEWKYPKSFMVQLSYETKLGERCKGFYNTLLPNFNPDAISSRLPFAAGEEFPGTSTGSETVSTADLLPKKEVEAKQNAFNKQEVAHDFLSTLDWRSDVEKPAEQLVNVETHSGDAGERSTDLNIHKEGGRLAEVTITAREEDFPQVLQDVNGGKVQDLFTLSFDENTTNPTVVKQSTDDWRALFDDMGQLEPAAHGNITTAASERIENLLFDSHSSDVDHAYSSMNLGVTDIPMHRNLSTPLLPARKTNLRELETGNAKERSGQVPPVVNMPRPPSAFLRPGQSKALTEEWRQNEVSKGKLETATFEDLLSSQGFTGSSSSKQSLASMKREVEKQALSPEEIRIRDWTEGKRRNLRGLLSSLHTVIWTDNDRWKEVNMSQLISPQDVKRCYRKACLAVHPDKLVGTPHERLARLIFTELNDAWNRFEDNDSPVFQ